MSNRPNKFISAIKKDVSILLAIGMMTICFWSALNHYYGSFKGGTAWIEASRATLSEALLEAQHHLGKLAYDSLVTKRDLSAQHQHLAFFRLDDEKWVLDSQSKTTKMPLNAVLVKWITQNSHLLDQAVSSFPFYRMKKLYFLSLAQNDNEAALLLTPIEGQFLDHLLRLTGTELIIVNADNETYYTSMKCDFECHPKLEDNWGQTQEIKQQNVLPAPRFQQVQVSSPYIGAYGSFHKGETEFNSFSIMYPLHSAKGEQEWGIWMIVPEDVMLWWPKLNILGIFLISLLLFFVLSKRLTILTQKHLEPIGSMILEVNQLRQSIHNDPFSTGPHHIVNGHGELDQLKGAIDLLKQQLIDNQRLQLQLTQSQKLEAIGTLSGGIAHDFNNLMSVILFNSESIFEDLSLCIVKASQHDHYNRDGKDLAAEWKTLVEEILIACNQAKVLTQQLLSVSRDRRKELLFFSIIPSCREVGELLQRTMEEHVALDVSFVDGELIAFGNENAFKQSLINLIINSRDAISDKGNITLKVNCHEQLNEEMLSTGNIKPGYYIRIQVSDDGVGIADEHLGQLFEPFFSLKDNKGTGLGLMIVYQTIVREMKGVINVISEQGKGTSFTLYVPLKSEKPEPKYLPFDKVMTQVKGQRIVVIEDNDIVRKSLKYSLERLGFKVIDFSGGSVFFQWLERNTDSVDLILSDVVMPDMGGPEIWDQVKQSHPELPFLFITGYAGEMTERYELPLDKVVEKPISPTVLKDRILEEIKTQRIRRVE